MFLCASCASNLPMSGQRYLCASPHCCPCSLMGLRPFAGSALLRGSVYLPALSPCGASSTCQLCPPPVGLHLPVGSAFSWGSVYLSALPFSWGSVRPPDLVFLRPLSRFSLVLGRLTLWLASVGRESVEEPEGAAPLSDSRPTSGQSYSFEQALSQVACIAKKVLARWRIKSRPHGV